MPTAAEQYELELINDARLDPLGDAFRYLNSFDPIESSRSNIQNAIDYFGIDSDAFKNALGEFSPAQPVAFSSVLEQTARAHDRRMIAANEQEHQLPGEPTVGDRLRAAGYDFQAAGENIFAYALDPLYTHAAFMLDWGSGPGGMQPGAGHRTNILDPDYREVGVGIIHHAPEGSGSVGPNVVTEDFGKSFSHDAIILGVDYNDSDGNGFYSIGEGVSKLKVSIDGDAATSDRSGGYTLYTSAKGPQTIELSGGGLAGPVEVTLDVAAAENIKLDVVNGDTLRTSVPVDVSGPINEIVGIGAQAGLSHLNGIPVSPNQHIVYGGQGNEVVTGDDGGNVFVFQRDGSHSEITNFQINDPATDQIDLMSFGQVGDFRQLMQSTHQVDGQAVITLGRTSITLDGVSKADLRGHSDAFLFHA